MLVLRVFPAYARFCLAVLAGLLLVGCGPDSTTATPPPIGESTPVAVPTDTPAPDPTAAPRSLILLASAGVDSGLYAEVGTLLNELAQANGLVYTPREGLAAADLATGNALVVALPPVMSRPSRRTSAIWLAISTT